MFTNFGASAMNPVDLLLRPRKRGMSLDLFYLVRMSLRMQRHDQEQLIAVHDASQRMIHDLVAQIIGFGERTERCFASREERILGVLKGCEAPFWVRGFWRWIFQNTVAEPRQNE